MIVSLIVMCAAAAAVVATVVSIATLVGLTVGRSIVSSCSPSAQARIYLAAALLPALVTAAIMVAALAPSFGWIADHCTPVSDLHGHPHICVHHEVALPALPVMVLAMVFGLRLLVVAARMTWLMYAAHRTRNRLTRQSTVTELGGARLLPVEEPQAFVIGIRRPLLFVTQGLLAPAYRRYLDVVLAHERAHVRRADPRRRFLAGLAFAFHVPGVARFIDRRLARSHEMAADEEAAHAIGSRAGVAQALVGLARAHRRVPRPASAFAGCDVEVRVRALLGPGARMRGPGLSGMVVAAAGLCLAIAGGAHAVHHGIEVVLGVLG